MIANMEAYKTGKSIREVARGNTDLSEEVLDELLEVQKRCESALGLLLRQCT